MCHENAVCSFNGKSGLFECMCRPGFFGNGYHCQPEKGTNCTKIEPLHHEKTNLDSRSYLMV